MDFSWYGVPFMIDIIFRVFECYELNITFTSQLIQHKKSLDSYNIMWISRPTSSNYICLPFQPGMHKGLALSDYLVHEASWWVSSSNLPSMYPLCWIYIRSQAFSSVNQYGRPVIPGFASVQPVSDDGCSPNEPQQRWQLQNHSPLLIISSYYSRNTANINIIFIQTSRRNATVLYMW